MRKAASIGIIIAAGWAMGFAQQANPSGETILEGGGIEVYVKVDFDRGQSPFKASATVKAELEDRPEYVVSGTSLHVSRAGEGGYSGPSIPAAVEGAKELKIAYCIRAKGMRELAMNYFDQLARDNTTPVWPPRLREENWQPVVLYVKGFRYNAGSTDDRVKDEARFSGILLFGREAKAVSGEYWMDKFIVYRGHDTQPPLAPSGLKAKTLPTGQVELTWKEPLDNAFPAVYSIYRKGVGKWQKVGESLQPRLVDSPTTPGRYAYRVTAADYENNCSEPSKDLVVLAPKRARPEKVTDDRIKDRLAYAANVRKIHAAGAGKVRPDVFLLFGDSITTTTAYLQAVGGHLRRGLMVQRGYSGQTTGFAKGKIVELLEQAKPEFAVIMFGTNDSKEPPSVAGSMENLAYVIDACARRGTVPVVATIPPRGFDLSQAGQRHFNGRLIQLCRAKKVPISYVFGEVIKEELRQMLQPDGVHLSAGPGNDAAGATLRQTFDQIYWALRDTGGSWR